MDVEANTLFNGTMMSRRAFTKLTALGTAAALGGISNVSAYPTKFVDELVEPASAIPVDVERTVYSVCEVCPFRC